MQKNIKIAVVLSGCGVFDGSEIHEATLTLLAIDKHNADYQCFAPDEKQHLVKNHYIGENEPNSRNILVESARIARGKISPLSKYSPRDFDAIIFPGGFGAALNLCSFALNGAACEVNNDVKKAILETFKAQKPIAGLCIAPALIAKVLGEYKIKVTIGNDKNTKDEIIKTGAKHENCDAVNICVDSQNKIVTCPCYMLASSISEVAVGVEKTVEEIIKIAVDNQA